MESDEGVKINLILLKYWFDTYGHRDNCISCMYSLLLKSLVAQKLFLWMFLRRGYCMLVGFIPFIYDHPVAHIKEWFKYDLLRLAYICHPWYLSSPFVCPLKVNTQLCMYQVWWPRTYYLPFFKGTKLKCFSLRTWVNI